MKKIYQRPTIEIIQVKHESLLAASPEVTTQPSVEPWEDGGEEELWLEEEPPANPATGNKRWK